MGAPFSPSSQDQEVQWVISPETQELEENSKRSQCCHRLTRVPANSFVDARTPRIQNVTLFGEKVFTEVLKLQGGH